MIEWLVVQVLFWLVTEKLGPVTFGVLIGLAFAWAPRLVMLVRLWIKGER